MEAPKPFEELKGTLDHVPIVQQAIFGKFNYAELVNEGAFDNDIEEHEGRDLYSGKGLPI